MSTQRQKYPALSKSQLVLAYGNPSQPISLRTLNSWLKPFEEKIGAYKGKMYTPKQIQIIFELLGEPENL